MICGTVGKPASEICVQVGDQDGNLAAAAKMKMSFLKVKHLSKSLWNGLNQRENRLRESLQTFITLHKARAVYHWEVAADTKLFQDSSLGNSACTSRCRTK